MRFTSILLILFLLTINSVHSHPQYSESSRCATYAANGVKITCTDIQGRKYVVGNIEIDATPAEVWAIVANPYEFVGQLAPNLKSVDLQIDEPNFSVMEQTYRMPLWLPDLKYVVKSEYIDAHRVEYERVSGAFHYFVGVWDIEPVRNGSSSLTYSIYLEPSVPLPPALIRFAVAHELPATLEAIKRRVEAVKAGKENKCQRHTRACGDFVPQW